MTFKNKFLFHIMRCKDVIGELRKILLIAFVFSTVAPVSATSGVTIGDLAVNLTNQMPPYSSMITGFTSIMGSVFFISGILKMKQHRESPQSTTFMGGPIFMVMGIFLVYFPTTVQYLYYSAFGDTESITGMTLYYQAQLMDGTSTSSVN